MDIELFDTGDASELGKVQSSTQDPIKIMINIHNAIKY